MVSFIVEQDFGYGADRGEMPLHFMKVFGTHLL